MQIHYINKSILKNLEINEVILTEETSKLIRGQSSPLQLHQPS